MAIFKIHHITRYLYTGLVKESISQIRIYPLQNEYQRIIQHEIHITDHPTVDKYLDYYGNEVGSFNLLQSHTELTIDSRFTIETSEPQQPHHLNTATLDQLETHTQRDVKLLSLAQKETIKQQDFITDLVSKIHRDSPRITDIAWYCSQHIFKHFKYQKGITSIETTLDEILDQKGGVCQDFAHLLLQMLRTIGIPCRYVSGYICPNTSGMRGEGATHAWVEFYLPNGTWVGIDPTNQVWANSHYVQLATGYNFTDCTPVKGSFKGSAQQYLNVYVSVGYEDGHVFEDVNEVILQPEPGETQRLTYEEAMQSAQQ